MAELGIGNLKHAQVVFDLAAVEVDAYGKQFRPVGRGRGKPNLLVPNDRRRPTFAVNGCLPQHIFFVAKLDRWFGCCASAIGVRTAKLIPIRLLRLDGGTRDQRTDYTKRNNRQRSVHHAILVG